MITIRAADSDDLLRCSMLRATYTTQAAWQIVSDADPLRRVDRPQGLPSLSFRLQQTRLPRALVIRLPSDLVPLAEVWDSCAIQIVALVDEHVCGYLLLQALPDQRQARIARFLVDAAMRGRGIGTTLLRAARSWALAEELVALRAHAPLRNVPGIEFYQRRGFRICGVSEHFYLTHEDALLMVRWL